MVTNDVTVLDGAVCAFGVFDGVHRGHEFIIKSALDEARGVGAPAVIVTFDIDPDEIFARGHLQKLMSNAARINYLSQMGATHILVLPFTKEFAAQPPMRFLDNLFGENTPISIHVGANFHFGAKAAGGVPDLKTWGCAHNMDVHAHEMYTFEDVVVSSTKIRELLSSGNKSKAEELLGHTL